MEANNLNHNLVAVLFPGLVKNDEKAIECMGGIRAISQAYSEPGKRQISLTFQPNNMFAKQIYGDCVHTAGVLLKVKIKKKKVNGTVKREVVSTVPVGRVKNIYRFESLCDFQYLPVMKEGTGSGPPKCILDQILPTGVSPVDYLTETGPCYIIPSLFTRFDKPVNLDFVEKKSILDKSDVAEDDDLHKKRRSERGGPQTTVKFSKTLEFPTSAHKFHLRQFEIRVTIHPDIENEFQIVKKIFENRPICSQNYIRYVTKLKMISLKLIMPCVAFYMIDGPWRNMWVRFGYDPRKDPLARKYQTLDFRVRHQAGMRSMVINNRKPIRTRNKKRRALDETYGSEDMPESVIYFRPGMVLAQRQVYYQLCDVELPEVQELLRQAPPAGLGCHEKRGWLAHNATDACRDHMSRYARETLLNNYTADMKLEQMDSSDEESNSDDDDATEASESNQ